MSMRTTALGLTALLLYTACADRTCGGCVSRLDSTFPEAHRVYDGVQFRLTSSGLAYVEQNLMVVIDRLIGDQLSFQVPTYEFSLGTICETPCPLDVEIIDVQATPWAPGTVTLEGMLNVDSIISMSSSYLDCNFDAVLRNKPISAQIELKIDPLQRFFYFEVSDVYVGIYSHEYDIQCSSWADWLIEMFKDYVTNILNEQIDEKLNAVIADLVAYLNCTPCDFYASGCPGGSWCDAGTNYCVTHGGCLVAPSGLAGVVDLSRMYRSWDPSVVTDIDMMITPGQPEQPSMRPLIRSGGLEMRMIGGAYTHKRSCVPEANPADIPPVGQAREMLLGDSIPGVGDSYMAALSISDMFLDYMVYQMSRAGMICFSLDAGDFHQLNTEAFSLFVPSLQKVTGGVSSPLKVDFRLLGVPHVHVGKGTYHSDGTIDDPHLTLLLPRLAIDGWVGVLGRWVKFVSVIINDGQVAMGLEFTPDNHLLPTMDADDLVVDDLDIIDYELVAEESHEVEAVVKPLVELFLPMLLDFLGTIQLVDLQGFSLNVKKLQGDMQRPGTDVYEFLSLYADLDFHPAPPPAVDTRVRLLDAQPEGLGLQVLDPATEIQYRLDGGIWSPFKPGEVVQIDKRLLPGEHELQVRARTKGNYQTLDSTPECFTFTTPTVLGPESQLSPEHAGEHPAGFAIETPTEEGQPQVGCSTVPGNNLLMGILLLAALATLARRNRL